jgi:uncharacterized lipoprotein YmbA
MRLSIALLIAIATLAFAACGSDDDGGLSRTQVEDRVAKEIGENEAKRASAACVEASEERTFRCKVTVGSVIGTYEARVSKDGERVLIDER